jgi:hypothetical protein
VPREKEQENPALANLKLVLGYLAIKDSATLEERVSVLARLGYENREIARICDTTPSSVAVRKAGQKKGKNRGKKALKRTK